MKKFRILLTLVSCLSLSLFINSCAEVSVGGESVVKLKKAEGSENILKKYDRVILMGDSITEQMTYTRYVELYLIACRADLKLRVMQSGWSGERAPGALKRLKATINAWEPDLVTLCYGMNDGSYTAYTEAIGKTYEDNMRKIIEALKKEDVTVIIGTPGVVDSTSFKRQNITAAAYNENLGKLGEIDAKLAKEYSMPFANIHPLMMDLMDKAKKSLGEKYLVAGSDGIHPGGNGHLIMAYAFLKAMGIDGNICTLSCDYKGSGTLGVSEGHEVLSFKLEGVGVFGENPMARKGTAEIKLRSTRYPFMLLSSKDNPNDAANPSAILPFLPFNQDLNRFTLTVKNLPTEKARVRWSADESSLEAGADVVPPVEKIFTREALEKGIELPQEFAQNPFVPRLRKLGDCIILKQNYERYMLREFFSSPLNANYFVCGNAVAESFKELERSWQDYEASIVAPLTHKIEIVPVYDEDKNKSITK